MTSAPIAPENASPSGRTPGAEPGAAGRVRAGAPAEPSAEQAARVLQQLRAHMAHGKSHVTVDLVPAELGRVALNVAMRGGKMSAIIRAESAQTLELVERQLPELRASLAQQGIEAERFELHLGFGEAGSRERFFFDPWKDAPALAALADAPVEEIDRGMPTGHRDDHGGVDLYA
jgi:flagellar hook-length control protein FliK